MKPDETHARASRRKLDLLAFLRCCALEAAENTHAQPRRVERRAGASAFSAVTLAALPLGAAFFSAVDLLSRAGLFFSSTTGSSSTAGATDLRERDTFLGGSSTSSTAADAAPCGAVRSLFG